MSLINQKHPNLDVKVEDLTANIRKLKSELEIKDN
jgi:hypothetical protein